MNIPIFMAKSKFVCTTIDDLLGTNIHYLNIVITLYFLYMCNLKGEFSFESFYDNFFKFPHTDYYHL